MKVSLITPVDIKYSRTGTERDIYEYAKFLTETGTNTTILIPDKGLTVTKLREDYKETERMYKHVSKQSTHNEPFRHFSDYTDLPKDSVIYFPMSIYDYLPNLLLKPKGQKYIMAGHGMYIFEHGHVTKHVVLEWIVNSALIPLLNIGDRKRNVFFHVINMRQHDYLRKLRIAEDRIFWIPCYVDTSQYKMKEKSGNRLKVLHIGGRNKNSQLVVKIIKQLQEEGKTDRFEFCFIGRGNGLPEEIAGLGANVSCLQNVTDKQKIEAMSKADVLLIPERGECFSVTMLEGLSCGLGLIVDDYNPVIDGLIKEKALAYKAKDIRSYISALMAISSFKQRKGYDDMRRQNRKIAIEKFDNKVILPMIKEMFVKVDERTS